MSDISFAYVSVTLDLRGNLLDKSDIVRRVFRVTSSTKKSVKKTFLKDSRRAVAPSRSREVARRHLVCDNCASWVHYETSGC